MKRLLALALLLLPALAQAEPLPVVASFSVLGDMVRQVGGDDVAVTVLVGPDSDSHVYEPSPSDTRRLAASRLFVVNGLGLEGWIPRLVDSAGFKGQVVTATDGITPLQLAEAGKTAPDPHAWQDLAAGRAYVRTIAAALEAADPAHAQAYAARAAAYDAELAVLNDWVRAQIGAVPPERRKIVTTHDAFQYFGHAYGVAFEAPVGMNEASEPDARAVAGLIRQIRAEHIRALFIENMTDPRLLEQLARETGIKPAGALFADALTKPGEGGETYVALFRHNVPAMVAAMMGD
jgi:zinc/manganese transport system substrate-binding protein